MLQAVHNIAGRAPDDTVKNLDTGLILECARQASDGALRNAALALVSLLAGKQPDNTLKHVLEVSILILQLCTPLGCVWAYIPERHQRPYPLLHLVLGASSV